MSANGEKRPKLSRVRRLLVRLLIAVAAFLGGYTAFLLIGALPVNRDFVETPDGVAIYVWSDAVHTDLIVPIRHSEWDWRTLVPAEDFASDTGWATHYAIGWGDRGFYLDTPTWAELKASTALKALFAPSGTVVHVQAQLEPDPEHGTHAERIRLTNEQYLRLCEAMASGFRDCGDPTPLERSHHDCDAFFPASGTYHCFYTCNSWAGDRLKQAGVCVPLWTPLPGSVTWYLSKDEP